MRPLLVLTAVFACSYCYSQQGSYVQKLQRPFKVDPSKKYLLTDSGVVVLPPSGNSIPNAITIPIPAPKKVGNNGNGQDIYILPLDKMPMIKPDSTYASKMPVVGRH